MPFVPSPLIPENPSSEVKVVIEWLDAVSRTDFATVMTVLAEGFSQSLHPQSLHQLPAEITDGHNIMSILAQVLPLMKSFMVSAHLLRCSASLPLCAGC